MSTPQQPPGFVPIEIAEANVPADGGLAGLGLIMSLVGGLIMVTAIAVATLSLIVLGLAGGDLGSEATAILIAAAIVTTTILRSWAHRAAGQRLLYEGAGTPRSAIKRYYTLAAVQTAVVIVTLATQEVPTTTLAVLFIMLAAWPVGLAVALGGARLGALLDQPVIPRGEDRGFEGAAILMVMLGLTGLLVGLMVAVGLFDQLAAGLELEPFTRLSLLTIAVMMMLRSSFQVRAGVRGVRRPEQDRVVGAVIQYGNFGILASGLICGITFLMIVVSADGHLDGTEAFLALVAMVFLLWALSIWPAMIKRFFVGWHLPDLRAERPGNGEAPVARARDRGLTTLGWLLFGQAVLRVSIELPPLLIGADDYYRGDPMSEVLASLQAGGIAPWWTMIMTVLQLGAAWQLMRMRPNHKLIVNLWSVTAALVAVYVHYPLLLALTRGQVAGTLQVSWAFLGNLSFTAVAISLVAPVVTFILVNRNQRYLPTAVLQK